METFRLVASRVRHQFISGAPFANAAGRHNFSSQKFRTTYRPKLSYVQLDLNSDSRFSVHLGTNRNVIWLGPVPVCPQHDNGNPQLVKYCVLAAFWPSAWMPMKSKTGLASIFTRRLSDPHAILTKA